MDRLSEIFERQRVLAGSFHHIERTNGVWDESTLEVDLLTLKGQERMRSLAWRVIEELAEALSEREQLSKAHEELVDVGHYLIELMICANVWPTNISRHTPAIAPLDTLDSLFAIKSYTNPSIDHAVSNFVTDLGIAMHQLKSKPHKLHPGPTDPALFQKALIVAFLSYVAVLVSTRISAGDFYDGYHKKNKVNHQRIAEGQ